MNDGCLIDSCVLIDVLVGGPWQAWSSAALAQATGSTWIDAVIVAEVSGTYARYEDFLEAVPPDAFPCLDLPGEAAFLAGRAHQRYRADGGTRVRTLPDFLIGAHAAVRGLTLITRDPRRYRRRFPILTLVAPDTHYRELAPAT